MIEHAIASPCPLPAPTSFHLPRDISAEIAGGHIDSEPRQQRQAQVQRLARLPAIDQAAGLHPSRLGKLERIEIALLDRGEEAIGVLQAIEGVQDRVQLDLERREEWLVARVGDALEQRDRCSQELLDPGARGLKVGAHGLVF